MPTKDRRRAILQAAEEMFLSCRFDQVTLDDVRRRARVGKGTIYRYFEGKEDLYARVILTGLDDLCRRLEQHVRGGAQPDAMLESVAEVLRDFYRKRKNLFRSAHAEFWRGGGRGRDMHREVRARRARMAELVASILQAGRRQGIYRADVPARAAAYMFLAMMRAAAGAGAGQGAKCVPPRKVVGVFLDGMRGGSK